MNSILRIPGICIRWLLRRAVAPFGYSVVPSTDLVDIVLHQYSSYEEYRSAQVFHNQRKLDQIWADERTLARVVQIVRTGPSARCVGTIQGLCHGTRNGYEQGYLNTQPGFEVIGTDISPTAKKFTNTLQWDFHDVKPDWVSRFDFVYSNSLDQSWKPRQALTTWLNQVRVGGLVILEHTETHGPGAAGHMDPFGVRPIAMPYLLTEWFGDQISISHSKEKKSNNNLDAWLFVLRKNVNHLYE